MHVRSRSKMQEIVDRAVDIALPGAVISALPGKVVNHSSLSKYQCALDGAIIMLQRLQLQHEPSDFYLLADSSPQAGYNFLLTTMLTIPHSGLQECFAAANRLCSLAHNKHEDHAPGPIEEDGEPGMDIDEGPDPDEVHAKLRERAALAKKLESLMTFTTNIPLCLGLGSTDLPAKVRCILHLMWLLSDTPRLPGMQDLLARIVSVTTDMGTEMGISDYEAPSLQSCVPQWMRPPQDDARGEVVAEDDGVLDPEHGVGVADNMDQHIFPRAMIVGGVLHIFHNASWKMDQAMSGFQSFMNGLKSVITLLHYKDNRELYVERCVKGTAFDVSKSPLHAGIPSAAEWRWGTIVNILKLLLPLRPVLQCTFDKAKMRAKEDKEGEVEEGPEKTREGKLDLPLIERTVRDSAWWMFAEMLKALHNVLSQFLSWCESCPCHCALRAYKRDDAADFAKQQRDAGADSAFDGPTYSCPLAGLRGPELAAGEWKSIIDDLCQQTLCDFLATISTDDIESLETVIADFETGKKQLYAALELKLQNWQVLPWLLSGVGHYNIEVARRVANECLKAWDRLSPDEQNKQHRIAKKFMASEDMKDEFIRFAQGDAEMDDLPLLHAEIARLRFVPVVERSIEAKHGLVHVKAGYRKVRPPYVFGDGNKSIAPHVTSESDSISGILLGRSRG